MQEIELLEADSRALDEPMVFMLENHGTKKTYEWLTDLLEKQRPALRSSNSKLLAYTGCLEAIDWLEKHVDSPVTTHWGEGAALLGVPWSRIKVWLFSDRHHQIMALDALYAFRLPAPNMAPLEQIADPVLTELPTAQEFKNTLQKVLDNGSNPRMRQTIDRIMDHTSGILTQRDRSVIVSDLPKLFLDPESFQNSNEILEQHEKVVSNIRQSISDILKNGES